MVIDIKRFGGVFPRLEPENLPENGAQIAKNCDLTSGALAVIHVTDPLVSLHDGDDGDEAMIPGIPTSELPNTPFIAKPNVPVHAFVNRGLGTVVTSGFPMMLQSLGALPTIKAYVYAVHIDPDTGDVVETANSAYTLTITGVEFTDSGLRIRAHFDDVTKSIALTEAGVAYDIIGPLYEFTFTADTLGVNGGPQITIKHPAVMFRTLPTLPGGTVPYQFALNSGDTPRLYANMQIIDVAGPAWTQEITPSEIMSYQLVGDDVTFIVDMNYVEPRVRYNHYVQTLARTINDDEKEGPPSEVSELIAVHPGEYTKLYTYFLSGYKTNLYIGEPGSKKFLLVEKTVSNPWADKQEGPQAIELPPYGNFFEITTGGIDKDDFIANSLIHPAQFGVAFTNDPNESTDANKKHLLCLSDQYRLHAWPKENTIAFTENILAITLAGNTILVFTGDATTDTPGKVWGVGGSNPKAMAKYLLSESHRLLNKFGLCRIGQTVYWPTHDGLAACNGGEIQIVTKAQFTRKEWADHDPEELVAQTAGRTIFLRRPSDVSKNLRIDLDETLIEATSFTHADWSFDAAVKPLWKSKKIRLEKAEIFDYCRIVTNVDVKLTVIADGSTVNSAIDIAVLDSGQFINLIDAGLTDLAPALTWEFQVEFKDATASVSARVQSLQFFERRVIDGQPAMQLAGPSVPIWESIWIKFPDRDRFVCGSLSVQAPVDAGADPDFADPVPIVFAGVEGELFTQDVPNGHVFRMPRDSGDNPLRDLWHVSVNTTAKINELLLFTRRSEAIKGNVQEINPKGGVPPWLKKRYQSDHPVEYVSGRVDADSYASLNLRLFGDASGGTDTPDATVAISDNGEFVIEDFDPTDNLEFDFDGKDYLVNRVTLFASDVIPIEAGGLIMRRARGVLNWRRRHLEFKETGSFSVARIALVNADPYPVALKLYARSGETWVLAQAITVSNNDEFKLSPDLPSARAWQVDIATTGEIAELHLIGRVRTEVTNGTVKLTRQREPFSWLSQQLVSSQPFDFSSARVEADRYPVLLRLYQQRKLKKERWVRDGSPFRFQRDRPESNWELDVVAAEGTLVEQVVLSTSMGRL